MPISPAPPTIAKYQQLAADLRRAILAGELAAGAQLPTEDELCRRYDVARGTVRRALAELAAEELIDAEHGVGSFVRAPHSNAAPFRFVEEGQAAGALTYRVLAQEVLPATPELAAQLKIVPGAPVIRVAQQALANGAVQSFSERWLPEALCPALATADLAREPAHALLARSAEPPVRAVIEIAAQALSDADAQTLGVSAGTAGLIVSRMSYTAPTRPAVWFRGVFRDHYQLGVELASVEC